MKLLTRLPASLALAISFLVCPGVRATTHLTEQFVGYSDGILGAAGTGGGGTIPGWYTPTFAITVTNAKGSLDGKPLGLLASQGTRVSVQATNLAIPITSGGGSYNKFVNSGAFPPTVDTNIYTSFLYRFNDAAEVSADGTFISAMNRQNSGWNNSGLQNSFSWFLMARNSGGNIQLGLTRWDSGINGYAETNYASVNLSAGQTNLIVIRQHIIPPAGTPDQIDLWINPPASTLGTNEIDIPPSDVSHNAGTDDTSSTGPGRFWVVSGGASAEFDELRIANTWAEATPPVYLCVTAGITSDPDSVTQVEGISTTLKVVGSGTSPTYQWQLSQDGGGSWNDIGGAVASTLTTPNLWIVNGDNGNKYRAIVSVACDSSSVTSAVATVTLTNAIQTPVGVLMDDFFGDPNGNGFNSRQDTPLTSSNSLWYTWRSGETGETDSGLDAFGSGIPSATGTMVGTPASGSSSLWLGYFVSNTTVVTLDIGRALKVTLPFTPTAFNSHTNNGTLRFGMFDYFDGGTNVTADASDITGSGGRAAGVRGYMLSVDFGTTFTANSPLSLLVRSGISDPNLMGTTGDYTSMGSGPSGGGFTGAPAFQPATQYTLEFTVTRLALNSARVAVAFTGGGTNWTFTSTETNLAYHRFDTFAIRPNSLETTADSFDFTRFKVEVLAVTLAPSSIIIDGVSRSGNDVTLNWTPTPAGSYTFNVQRTDDAASGNWSTIATGLTGTTYTDTTATGDKGFYRVTSP